MSELLEAIIDLVSTGHVRISDHGYDEIAADGLLAREVVDGVKNAVIVEEYPDYPKGKCVLVLQKDVSGREIHAVWGIPKGHDSPAVLITAYKPDPERWHKDFLRRRN